MRSTRTPPKTILHTLTRGFALSLVLAAPLGCDSDDAGDAKAEAGDKAGGATESELANKANEEVKEMKAELEKGEDIKYSCAGNLAQYEELGASAADGDKKAYQAMVDVCFVDAQKAAIANLRTKMAAGELSSMDTINLTTLLEDDKFPKEGEAVKLAEEAKKLLEVEMPTDELKKQIAEAIKDKEAGKSVSMGCIKGKQIIDKSGEAMGADEAGKAALAEYAAACPEK